MHETPDTETCAWIAGLGILGATILIGSYYLVGAILIGVTA